MPINSRDGSGRSSMRSVNSPSRNASPTSSRTPRSGAESRPGSSVRNSAVLKSKASDNNLSGNRSKHPSSTGSARSKAARRRKRRQRRAIAFGLLFLAGLLCLTVAVVVRSVRSPEPEKVIQLDPASDRFKSNVVINGKDVTGMTLDEARIALKPDIDKKISDIAITLKGENYSATITAGQLNVQTDLEQVLSSAFAGNPGQTYSSKLTIDETALAAAIRDLNASLSYGPTDASFTMEVDSKGKPSLKYIDGKPGMGFDVDATVALIKKEIDSGNYVATLSPALTSIPPAITVDDLKSEVTEIGRYTTTYCAELPSDNSEEDRTVIANRSFNIQKASGIINGKIINPGATFSFNKTVGDRTEKAGWRQAKGIYGGETFNMQYGGGVCQVSTTMYVAIMRAGIPFSAVTRREHSIPSTYVPKGLDATVDSGHIDFKFKNTTDKPIYIFAYSTVNKKRSRYRDLTVVIYGRALPEGITYDLRSVIIEELEPGEPIISRNKKQTTDYNVVTVEARKGYVVDVYLDTLQNGKIVKSDLLYNDRYEAVTEKRTVGTIEPTPVPGIPDTPSGEDIP